MKPLGDLAWRAAMVMNPLVLAFAVLTGLVLAAVAVSFVALFRAGSLAREAIERAQVNHAACTEAVESLRRECAQLGVRLSESRQPATVTDPAALKPGLNLSKRSQALRMHRRGVAPIEIASSLGVPLQEVDLLLKVHRIVISSIG
jgi:hypothetical protein